MRSSTSLRALRLDRREVDGDPRLRGTEHELRGHRGEPGTQVVGEHLGVAGRAEHAAEPLQLAAQVPGVRLPEDRR